MIDVDVIDDPAAAESSLDPVRARLLAELRTPASATMLSQRLGLPRQRVNYHLRALERHGLLELVEERRRGNVTERVVQATAASYVISPAATPDVAPDPARVSDRLSARWLLALAARLVRDVGALIAGARRAERRLATFAIEGEITFGSAPSRARFAQDLSDAVAQLVADYHVPVGASTHTYRMVVAVHPTVANEERS